MRSARVVLQISMGILALVAILLFLSSVFNHPVGGRTIYFHAKTNGVFVANFRMPHADALRISIWSRSWSEGSDEFTNHVKGKLTFIQDGKSKFEYPFDSSQARREGKLKARCTSDSWAFFSKFADKPDLLKQVKAGKDCEIRVSFDTAVPGDSAVTLIYTLSYFDYVFRRSR